MCRISDPDHQVKGDSLSRLACTTVYWNRFFQPVAAVAFNFPMGKPPSRRWQADEFLYQEAENRPPIFR